MAMFTDRELMMIAIALDDDHHENKNKRKWVQDAWKNRDSEGEFALLFKELVDDETKFFQYFRMSERTFNLLFSKVAVHLKKRDTPCRKAITPKERLAVCLRFLATGDSYQTISHSYRMGISTVCSIVRETCKVICETLMSTMLPKPSENMWKSIANDFNDVCNFPNCLGALDAKYITTQAPTKDGPKNTHSIVLFALVDAHNNFITVDVGEYGNNCDGEIFASSKLFKAIEGRKLAIPGNAVLPNTSTEVPYVMVADETFPLKTYLMRPYPRQNLDDSKTIYNHRLARVRRVVEDTLGMLSQKFRIYNKRIQTAAYTIDNIVLTTCILHNFIKKYDENSYTSEIFEDDEFAEDTLENLPLQEGDATRDALDIRDKFKDYFNSVVESVSKQEESNLNVHSSV